MPGFLQKFIDNSKKIWGKLSTQQKIIGGVVLVAAVIGIIVILNFSTSDSGVPLFTHELKNEDFDRITERLTELSVPFTTENKTSILVQNAKIKNKVIMQLAESGFMPKGKYTFLDIIKDKSITTSRFQNDVKIRAAVESKLEEMLRASDLLDDVNINFTVPKDKVFINQREPVKVAVVLTPVYGEDLTTNENKKLVKGYEQLVINSIDGATREFITITDNNGRILNDFSDETDTARITTIEKNLKIREAEIAKYKAKLYEGITNYIPEDRVAIVVDVQMNFDVEKEKRTELLPVVLKEDDPSTPYDDGERKYSLTISQKRAKETFTGPNWIPEGPPGFDPNVPPAYKGALEQMTKYVKEEDILNEDTGRSEKDIEKDYWDISKITASVAVDGTWEIEYDEKGSPVEVPGGGRKRKFTPIDDNTLKSIKGFVSQGIGFSINRGDKVEVYGVKKDRSSQFSIEDAMWRRQKRTFWIIISILVSFFTLIVVSVIYRVVMKEIERKRRLREEELARQHQLAREMALKNAEDEGVEVEMSAEDRARLEMQENAVNLAREHPEDVAQLIRTWLQEE